jgi:peptide/nickel transport system substrate-binding protein
MAPTGDVYVPIRQVPGVYPSAHYKGPRPTTFQESPQHAQMVKDGTLPPLMERLPKVEDILVLDVVDEIGVYGGTWRRTQGGFTAPFVVTRADCIFEDYDHFLYNPYICADFTEPEDGRKFTFTLRDGHKWSDGTPFTMEDVRFAWEELNYPKPLTGVHNQEYNTWRPAVYKDVITGNPPTFAVEDELTWSLEYDTPAYNFLHKSEHTRNQRCTLLCFYAPSHYSKQFHPSYQDPAELSRLIAEGEFKDWTALFKYKHNPRKGGINGYPWNGAFALSKGGEPSEGFDFFLFTANAYYPMVDPLGNQLPYTEAMLWQAVEGRDVAIFRAMAGETDEGNRGLLSGEIPLYVANMEKGDYSLYRYGEVQGHSVMTHNQTYNEDPEIGYWMRNKDFRAAMALTVDRDALNALNYLGLGTVHGVAPAPGVSQYSPGAPWTMLHTEYNIDKAKAALDAIGLVDTDGDGIRNRIGILGGSTGNLELFAQAQGAGEIISVGFWAETTQIVKDGFADAGIQLDFAVDSGHSTNVYANKMYYSTGGNTGFNPFGSWGGTSVIPTSGDGMGGNAPAIGQYLVNVGDCTVNNTLPGTGECMAPTGPEPTWLPLAPRADTWPADSTGYIKEVYDIWRDAVGTYPFTHPEHVRIGQELWRKNAEWVGRFPFACCAPTNMTIKRNNFRNVPKEANWYYTGTYKEVHYFEDGIDNLNHPDNRSKRYKSESFVTGLTY